MDWSRAKSILITAFLILNVFLIVQIFGQQEARIPVSEYQEINSTIIKLLEDRYQVSVSYNELPTTVPKVQTLISWQDINEEDVIAAFWPGQAVEDRGDSLYLLDDEFIQFTGERYTYWSNNLTKYRIDEASNIFEHIELASQDAGYIYLFATSVRLYFTDLLGISFDDWVLDNIAVVTENEINYYDLYFVQNIGLPLYDAGSSTQVRVDFEGRVCGVKRSVIKVEQREQSLWSQIREKLALPATRTIITSAEALLSLASQAQFEAGSAIIDIKLAYYGLGTAIEATEDSPAVWQVTPVYSIKVKAPDGSGRSYFINPYTGKLVE